MKSKKLLALVLTCSFTLSLGACGTADGTAVSDPSVSQEATGSTGTETSAGEESQEGSYSYSGFNPLDYGMEPFEEKVHIQIPVFDRAKDDLPDVVDNYYTRWINENFGANMNVEVEFVPIPRADTMGAYNLLLAGGEWPTVFMEYDWDKVSQWAHDGALAEYDLEEFKDTAPVWFEKAGGQPMFDMFIINDSHMFAPALRPDWNVPYTYIRFYRLDWYEKAGLELPKTYEEYFNAISTFIELGYTDGTPPIKKSPYTANFGVTATAEWPRDEEKWVMYSGTTVAALAQDSGMYEALKRANTEYHAGFNSSEFELDATGGSSTQALADFVSGKSYSYGWYISPDMPELASFYENNPDAKLGILYDRDVYFTGYEEGVTEYNQQRANNPVGMFVGFSSKASEDEIKAAWLYMEWMAQKDVLFFMQNGVEGETYNLNEDGLPIAISDYTGEYQLGYGNNKDYWCIVVEAKSEGTPEETIRALAPQGLPQDFTDEILEYYYYQKMYADDGLVYPDPFFSVPIEAVNEYAGTLEALFIEYATDLTKCDPDKFDELYNTYVQNYLDAGYQEIIDERLQAYKDGYTTRLPDIAAGRKPFVPTDPKTLGK